eukprot:204291-Prymnesium_polylepis.1
MLFRLHGAAFTKAVDTLVQKTKGRGGIRSMDLGRCAGVFTAVSMDDAPGLLFRFRIIEAARAEVRTLPGPEAEPQAPRSPLYPQAQQSARVEWVRFSARVLVCNQSLLCYTFR